MSPSVKMMASIEGKFGAAGSHPDVVWSCARRRASHPLNTKTDSDPTGWSVNGSASAVSAGVQSNPSEVGFEKSHVQTNFSKIYPDDGPNHGCLPVWVK